MPQGDLVLVTGANGFIAKHCIAGALARGYRVRGTVRRPEVGAGLLALADRLGHRDRLEVVSADLLSDSGWDGAVTGCRFVLHTASPFPLGEPRDRAELIAPARDGTLRVLGAAARAGVEHCVVTSSTAAIVYGGEQRPGHVYDETDWSSAEGPISAYSLSKTLAERAAWDFIGTDRSGMSLSVINPSATFGPALDGIVSTSGRLIRMLLSGRLPMLPKLSLIIVDARDVAEAHLRALETEAARGQRIIAASDTLWVREVAAILAREFPGKRIARREIPTGILRFASRLIPAARARADGLGVVRTVSNAKARTLLGMQFRSAEEAVLSLARSLLEPAKS